MTRGCHDGTGVVHTDKTFCSLTLGTDSNGQIFLHQNIDTNAEKFGYNENAFTTGDSFESLYSL